jgi:ABC-type hemin transport system ATPase subunit
MAIRSFDVGSSRSLHRAAATDLPNLVAISGPNGSGKSTVLELLNSSKPVEAGTEVMYVGPHRTWRSSPVGEVAVLGIGMEFGDILKQDSMPGFQYPIGNLNILNGYRRVGSSGDDAQAYVKASIIRIRNKKQRLITRNYDTQGAQIKAGTVPDLFEPFRELVNTLLPHLEWVGVNDTNTNDIRCEFRPVGSDISPFDIDELSSGEKAAIALFLPFVEREVSVLAGEKEQQERTNFVPVTVLIDEPELHLHALLQLNVLEYMRQLAKEGRVQFIFTVHSPSLLDALTPDELFLLVPSTLAADNQLSRLVDSSERLEAVRSVTGSTHMLTRCKPIVFIEGEPDNGARATDERIMKIMMPEAAHWALIASKGKAQVIKVVTDMRHSELRLPGIPVFGLVDGDQGKSTPPDYVIPWPVAMMENLLLDNEAIYNLIKLYPGVCGLNSPAAVRDSLLAFASDQIEEERRLRLKEQLPQEVITIDCTNPTLIEATINAAASRYKAVIAKLDLVSLQKSADDEVQAIVDAGEQLERFHGKKLLRKWYDRYFAKAGMGWNPFLIQLAAYASANARAANLIAIPLSRIRLYFPREVISLLQACPDSEVCDALLAECTKEFDLWKQGRPEGGQRELLRRRVVQYAREGSMDELARAALIKAAMEIGTF